MTLQCMRLSKALSTCVRTYSLFKSGHLNTDIKLGLYKALIRSVMTCACPARVYSADVHQHLHAGTAGVPPIFESSVPMRLGEAELAQCRGAVHEGDYRRRRPIHSKKEGMTCVYRLLGMSSLKEGAM
jgi:hypothetical protein